MACGIVTMSRDRKVEIADWVVDTCLTFGTSIPTAYKIAGLFIEALEQPKDLEGEGSVVGHRRAKPAHPQG